MFERPSNISIGKLNDDIEFILPILQDDGLYTHILRHNIHYYDDGLVTTHDPNGHQAEFAKGIQTQIMTLCPSYPMRLAEYQTYIWAMRQTQRAKGDMAILAYNSLPVFWGSVTISQATNYQKNVHFYQNTLPDSELPYQYDDYPELFPPRLKRKDIQRTLLKGSLLHSQFKISQIDKDIPPLALAIIGFDHPDMEDLAANRFWENLISGGIMIIDDFGAYNARPERQKHWITFAKQQKIPLLPLPTGQTILIK